MTTIVFEGRVPKPHTIVIGMEGEHNAETILFEGLPEIGTPVLNVVLPDGTGDVMTITDDGTVTFTRNQTVSGTLVAWVSEFDGDNVVWKSEKFYMAVGDLPDIEGPVEQRYPTFVEEAIADVTEIASLAVEAKEAVFGMSAQAETLPAGESATASYSQGVLSLGIPTGPKGDAFEYSDFTPEQLAGLKGPQGDPGPTPSFSIGTVEGGDNPGATITGTDANPVLNLTLPKGDKGDDGDPPEIGIGTVSTGAAGTSADVTITGSGETGYELNFTIPRGDKGDTGQTGQTGQTGATGATPNLTVGTVTTGAAGTQASATITGTAENPVLNLTIPRGADGGGVPTGGTAGQVLRKNSGNTAAEWGGYSVPTGGSTDQVLAKNSETDGDLKWETVSGGATSLGQLSDVDTSGAAQYDGLVYFIGRGWAAGAPTKFYNIVYNAASNPYIDGIWDVYTAYTFGYRILFIDEGPDYEYFNEYFLTNIEEHENNGYTEYVCEIMRIKPNGKIEKRVFSERHDFNSGDDIDGEETPAGMISNTETLTQAAYAALVSAGTVDSQTLYCIKENV